MARVDWDVIVIGSGLGGLSVAARLARAGISVLVVEAHDRPGGYASVFERGPFRFDVSLHLMDAVGRGQHNYQLLAELGVAERLSFLAPERLRREIWPDWEFRPPIGMAAYSAEIAERLGLLDPGLMRLGELAATLHQQYVLFSVSESKSAQPGATLERVLPSLRRASAADVINAHVQDRRVQAHLNQFACGWLGVGIQQVSALSFLIPWYSYHHFGGAYPLGGSSALTEALCDVIKSSGGRIELSSNVQRILVARRRVTGIELCDGSVVSANTVISNANPLTTFAELIDREHVASAFVDAIRARRGSVSAIKIWLGLRRAPMEPHDYDVYLCSNDHATDESGFVAPLSLVIPSNLDQRLVPSGRGIVAITRLVDADWYMQRCQAESGFKDRIVQELLVRMERTLLPGLSAEIDVLECATPSTFQRFTNNPSGAIYGFWGGLSQRPMKHTTPIDGLYLASAWTSPGGGFTATMMAGRHVALQILNSRRMTGSYP